MRSSFVVIVSLLLLQRTAHGWWDEGHMTIAAIAKSQLTGEEVGALEGVLALWENDYPGMSTLPSAAVWPDAIKTPGRGVVGHVMDNLSIFNTWHYSSIPYNPQQLIISRLAAVSHRVKGAYVVLDTLYKDMTESPSGLNLKQGSGGPVLGSPLSWNLLLRLFMHIYGDIHQPLHACESFSTQFPHGDQGGNRILTSIANFTTLHGLWDGCAGGCTRSWPALKDAEVEQSAAEIARMHPIKSFGNLVTFPQSVNFRWVANGSHKICTHVVYSEIFGSGRTSSTVDNNFAYHPSASYMNGARGIASRQMALGGYRLATLLRQIAPHARAFLRSYHCSPGDCTIDT